MISNLIHRSQRGIRFLAESARVGGNMLEQLMEERGTKRITSFIGLLDYLAGRDEYEYLAKPAYSPLLNPKHEDRINHAIGYIYEHHAGKLRLAEVASVSGMPPESFRRFFKKATGTTFIGFLNELRISNACWFLQQSNQTVTEICFACGFSNLSNFNRRFRKIKDMTPAEYRKKSPLRSA